MNKTIKTSILFFILWLLNLSLFGQNCGNGETKICYVSDVNDNLTVNAGETFTKSWVVENHGSNLCSDPPNSNCDVVDHYLAILDDDGSDATVISAPKFSIPANETETVSISLQINKPGRYFITIKIIHSDGTPLPNLGEPLNLTVTVTSNNPPPPSSDDVTFRPNGFNFLNTLFYKCEKDITIPFPFDVPICNYNCEETKYITWGVFIVKTDGGEALYDKLLYKEISIGPASCPEEGPFEPTCRDNFPEKYDRNSDFEQLGAFEKNLPGKYRVELRYIVSYGNKEEVTATTGTVLWTRDIEILKPTSEINDCDAFINKTANDYHKEAYRGELIQYTWNFEKWGACNTENQYWQFKEAYKLDENGIPTGNPLNAAQMRFVFFEDKEGILQSDRAMVGETPDNKIPFSKTIYFSVAPYEPGPYKLIFERHFADGTVVPHQCLNDPFSSSVSPYDEANITIKIPDRIDEKLEFTSDGCINVSANNVVQNNNIDIDFKIKNTGNVGFVTNLQIVLRAVGGTDNSALTTERIRIEHDTTISFNYTIPVSVSPGDYEIIIKYLTDKENPTTPPKIYEVDNHLCSPVIITVTPNVTPDTIFKLLSPGTPVNSPLQDIETLTPVLRWYPMNNADHYHIKVTNKITGEVVFDSMVDGTESSIPVPPNTLEYQTEYVFYGEAVHINGNIIPNETAFHFRTPVDYDQCIVSGLHDSNNNQNASEEIKNAYCFLISRGILKEDQSFWAYDENILRIHLAKVAALGVFGDANDFPEEIYSDLYPTPYMDLAGYNTDGADQTELFRAAKFETYFAGINDTLRVAPFKGINGLFYASGAIEQKYVLKVLLETFSLHPDNGRTMQDYEDLARRLHIIDPIDGISNAFEPDKYASRAQVFVWLTRIMQNNALVKPTFEQLTDKDNFLEPGMLEVKNTTIVPNIGDGLIKNVVNTGMSFPGIGIGLDFSFSYNNQYTEVDDKFYPEYPMGSGFSHSYLSYIVYNPGYSYEVGNTRYTQLPYYAVFWPQSIAPVYFKKQGSNLEPITKGIYYDAKFVDGKIIITDLDKNTFTFAKQTGDADNIWRLVSVKDRNDNEITITYRPNSQGTVNVHKVFGTKGYNNSESSRIFTFWYDYPEDDTKLTSVTTSYIDANDIGIAFEYENGLLSKYYDMLNFNTREKFTSYHYTRGANGETLLYRIRLPKGNYIDNNYHDNKLKSTQVYRADGTPSGNAVTSKRTYIKADGTVVSTITDAEGITSQTERNKQGYITKIIRKKSNGTDEDIIKYFYNDSLNSSKPTKIIYNDKTISITYNDVGQKQTSTLTAGGKTITEQWWYNTDHRLVKYKDPRGNFFYSDYDDNGNVIWTTDANNVNKNWFYYDNRGLLEQVRTIGGYDYIFKYNYYGQVDTVIAPGNIISVTHYNNLGLKDWEQDPEGNKTFYSYKINGILESITDADGNTVKYEYDDNYNLISTENPLGGKTILDYYPDNDMLKSQTFNGKTISWKYKNNGQLSEFTKADGKTITFDYFANGLLRDDGFYIYSYDTQDRPKLIIDKNSSSKISYDHYDFLDRLDQYTITRSDNTKYTVKYEFDNNGNITKIIYPDLDNDDNNNYWVAYFYDANNRLERITDKYGKTFTGTRFVDGGLQILNYPNGTQKRNVKEKDKTGRLFASANTDITQDPPKNICGWIYEYNDNGLVEKEHFIEPEVVTDADEFDIDYYHTENTNILTGNSRDGTNTYKVNDNGEIINHPYYSSINFNDQGELKLIETTDNNYKALYFYDPLGNRDLVAITGQGVTHYSFDITDMGNILTEETPDGHYIYYVYGFGQLLYSFEENNNTPTNQRYYHTDMRGSVIAITNENAQITHSYAYSPYGEILQQTEPANDPTPNKFKYIGGLGVIHDYGSLYYMRARYYDCKDMRFVSYDPIWNINLFAYAGNNPVNYIDATGKKIEVYETDDYIINGTDLFLTIKDSPFGDLVPYAEIIYIANSDMSTDDKVAGISSVYIGGVASAFTAVTLASSTVPGVGWIVAGVGLIAEQISYCAFGQCENGTLVKSYKTIESFLKDNEDDYIGACSQYYNFKKESFMYGQGTDLQGIYNMQNRCSKEIEHMTSSPYYSCTPEGYFWNGEWITPKNLNKEK